MIFNYSRLKRHQFLIFASLVKNVSKSHETSFNSNSAESAAFRNIVTFFRPRRVARFSLTYTFVITADAGRQGRRKRGVRLQQPRS